MESKVHDQMSQVRVTLIDYGMGNIWSVVSALKFLGADITVSSDPKVVKDAEVLLNFPNKTRLVGSFGLTPVTVDLISHHLHV